MKSVLQLCVALLCLYGTTASAQKQFYGPQGTKKLKEDKSILMVRINPETSKSNFINSHARIGTWDSLQSNKNVTAFKLRALVKAGLTRQFEIICAELYEESLIVIIRFSLSVFKNKTITNKTIPK